LFALFGGEVVAVDGPESVGLVGVADQEPLAVGDEQPMVGAAHRRQVGEVVGATPAAGPEVVDLEPGSQRTVAVPARPVAQQHRSHDLG
jgi:hypothetical protein